MLVPRINRSQNFSKFKHLVIYLILDKMLDKLTKDTTGTIKRVPCHECNKKKETQFNYSNSKKSKMHTFEKHNEDGKNG